MVTRERITAENLSHWVAVHDGRLDLLTDRIEKLEARAAPEPSSTERPTPADLGRDAKDVLLRVRSLVGAYRGRCSAVLLLGVLQTVAEPLYADATRELDRVVRTRKEQDELGHSHEGGK